MKQQTLAIIPDREPEIGTLRDRALLEQTKNRNTLGQVFAACNETSMMSDACFRSGYFWKKTLARLFGDYFVDSRSDITLDQWYDFAILLSKGIEYKYATLVDYGQEHYDEKIVSYNLIYNKADPDPDPEEIIVTIPASLPASGSRGYLWKIEFNSESGSDKSEIGFFHGVNPDSFNYIMNHLAKLFIDYHNFYYFGGQGSKSFMTIIDPEIDVDDDRLKIEQEDYEGFYPIPKEISILSDTFRDNLRVADPGWLRDNFFIKSLVQFIRYDGTVNKPGKRIHTWINIWQVTF